MKGTNDFFYYTGKSQHDVIIRKKEIYVGLYPSGNSVMMANLLYLSVIYNRERKEWEINLINKQAEVSYKISYIFCQLACIFIDQIACINEIAVVGKTFEILREE